MSEQQPLTLEFSERQTEAIFGYMLRDYSFFLKCIMNVPYNAFREPVLSSAVKALYDFYNSMPVQRKFTIDEYDGYLASHKYASDQKSLREIRNKIDMCLAAVGSIGFDLLSRNMTGWLQLYKTKHMIVNAADIYNKKDYLQALNWIKTEFRSIESTSFESMAAVDFMKYAEILESKKADLSRRCTIGDPEFDKALSGEVKPDSTQEMEHLFKNDYAEFRRRLGGLIPGDVTVVIGPTNAGKTTFLTTIVAQNIMIGRKVLYITHEQKYEDVVEKVVQSLLGITKEEARTQAGIQKVYEYKKILDNLKYWPYVKSGEMYVENVIPQIRLFQEEEVATTGRGYDMLVVDYPGKLKSKLYANKKASTHDEVGYVYEQFMIAALEFRMHGVLAAQTNREGFKVNRGDSDRNLDAADIGKSFDISTMADNIITINRNDEDIQHRRVRFHVPKSRSAEKGWTMYSSTAYHLSRTHGFGMKTMIVKPGMIASPEDLNTAFPEPTIVRKQGE